MFVNELLQPFLDDNTVGVGAYWQECQDKNQISHHCFEADHFVAGNW
jgi:hypothetical protein